MTQQRKFGHDLDEIIADADTVIRRSSDSLEKVTGRRTRKPLKIVEEKPVRKKLDNP